MAFTWCATRRGAGVPRAAARWQRTTTSRTRGRQPHRRLPLAPMRTSTARRTDSWSPSNISSAARLRTRGAGATSSSSSWSRLRPPPPPPSPLGSPPRRSNRTHRSSATSARACFSRCRRRQVTPHPFDLWASCRSFDASSTLTSWARPSSRRVGSSKPPEATSSAWKSVAALP